MIHEEYKYVAQTQFTHTRTHAHTHTHTHTHTASELVERRLLVLINPVGGKRRGVTDFDRIVRPMFDVAEIKYEIVITGE